MCFIGHLIIFNLLRKCTIQDFFTLTRNYLVFKGLAGTFNEKNKRRRKR